MKKACISESAQCYHLEFVIEELASLDFAAGQFISTLAVDGNGKLQTRAYSLASAANANKFELCVNRVEGGFFSNHLADLPEGGTIQVHGPHGNFTLRAPLTDSIFVATGTGIAPMRSFTQWLFPEAGEHAGQDRSQGKDIWLVYGTRHESELYYRDYFERVAAEHENFHYIKTLSRAPAEWSGLRGYVQEYVGHIVDERNRKLAPAVEAVVAGHSSVAVAEPVLAEIPAFDIHTYICGLNNMVSAVRDKLTGYGWHKKQIIFERYD